MPKKIVDYSKTVMYKILCDDDDSDFLYIGHTTNFVKRKCAHKSFTNGIENNRKLYRLIRANGGWTNFRMLEIEKYACNDKREAEAREDALMQELTPNMNSYRACRNKEQYYQDNKKTISENSKKYYQHTRQARLDYETKYYADNKAKIKALAARQYVCKCGSSCRTGEKSKHFKSKKHLKYIADNELL